MSKSLFTKSKNALVGPQVGCIAVAIFTVAVSLRPLGGLFAFVALPCFLFLDGMSAFLYFSNGGGDLEPQYALIVMLSGLSQLSAILFALHGG